MADTIIPPAPDLERRVIGWGLEAVEEGDAFLRSQIGYSKIPESISSIMGENKDLRPSWLSSTTCNHIGNAITNLASMMTDIKPFWEYRTSNRRFERQSEILGKLDTHWYLQRQIDLRMGEVIKWWAVGGTGWGHLYWDENIQDNMLSGEDPRDVLPIRPGSNISIQDAFGVISRRERTVNYLKRRFPEKADEIKADGDGSMFSTLMNSRVGRMFGDMMGSPFHDRLFGKAHNELPRIPTSTVYTIYVKDPSTNEKSYPVVMGPTREDGTPATNWAYLVMPGEALYPNLRCIEFTKTAVLYDGPSIYWHGLFPFIKMTLDPWPWSWLGKAPAWDLVPLQKSLDRNLRVVDDHNEQVARPGVIADKNSVSKANLDRLDTRRAGYKMMQNPLAGKGAQVITPPPLDQNIFKTIEFLMDRMDTYSGVRDMSQLMRLNQMPSGDTIDRMMEAMTPSVRGRSRNMEAFAREFATMLAYNFAQFYTMPMRLSILGVDGITKDDFDYDPGTLIPDYVDSDDFDVQGNPTAEAIARGPMPRYNRAREYLRQFTFEIAPGSLLASSEIERKMMYLQLARAGYIDRWTLLEVLGIPNVGEAPAATISERLVAEAQMGMTPLVNPAGRKASGQGMPRLTVKES